MWDAPTRTGQTPQGHSTPHPHKHKVVVFQESALQFCFFSMTKAVPFVLTWDADVARLQVRLEFLEAGFGGVELRVRDPDLALPASRAPLIDQVQNVHGAAQITQVRLHAPPCKVHTVHNGPFKKNTSRYTCTGTDERHARVLRHGTFARTAPMNASHLMLLLLDQNWGASCVTSLRECECGTLDLDATQLAAELVSIG